MVNSRVPLSDEEIKAEIDEAFQAWVEYEVKKNPECFS